MNALDHYEYNEAEIRSGNLKSLSNIKFLFGDLERIDDAMLSSILSFAVYEKNSWVLDNIHNNLSDMTAIVNEAIKDKEKMYCLKVWHFIKNIFEKIPDHELKIPPTGFSISSYGYEVSFSYKDGQYSAANGLAHACVLKTKNPNDRGYTLHLTFRGTEFARLMEYIKGPYLDMSAYYENFKPLVNYIKEYVNNPSNKITELHVNGHSLGGAMVQEFLKDNSSANFEPIIKGFTFGSPGSEKKWYHKFATVAYHALGRGIKIPINPNSVNPNCDGRITQFYHSNDPVPLVGLLGYTKGGSTYKLPDIAYHQSKKANLEKKLLLEDIPAFGTLVTYFKESIINKFNTKFHDSARYTMNLKNKIESYYQEYHELNLLFTQKSVKNLQNWIKYEDEFNMLSFKYKNQLEDLIKKDEPMLTKDDIKQRISNLRNRIRYNSDAEMILEKEKITKKYYDYNSEVNMDNAYNDSACKVNKTLEKIRELQKIEHDTSTMKKAY
jgi:hypothetical protein